MSKRRAMFFLKRIITLLVVSVFVAFIVWLVNDQTGILSPVLDPAIKWLDQADRFLNQSMMKGISAGMIVLAVLVLFFPLLMKGIRKTQYLTAVRRGTIASTVFYFSQLLYKWAGELGQSYLILSMGIVLFISFVIIEVFSRFMRSDEEASFRTDMLASMAAGLVSSIVFILLGGFFS